LTQTTALSAGSSSPKKYWRNSSTLRKSNWFVSCWQEPASCVGIENKGDNEFDYWHYSV